MNAYLGGEFFGALLITSFLTWAASRIWLRIFKNWHSRYPRLFTANILSFIVVFQAILLLIQPDTEAKQITAGVFLLTMIPSQLLWLAVDCFKPRRGSPRVVHAYFDQDLR